MKPRLIGRLWWGTALLAGLVALGCGGQSKYLEDEEWSREQEPDGGAWREAENLFTPEQGDPGRFDHELNGVRLDLSPSPKAPPTARCACADVFVGRAGDAGFVWGQQQPLLGPDQMIVALRTEGSECSAAAPEPALRRMSIKAVDTQGKDVVVVLENLPIGRPVALGAITNRPQPGGSLYVRPATKQVPYGGALGGTGSCRVFTRGQR